MLWRVLWGWPFPRWVNPAIGIVMATLTFAVNRSLLDAEYVLWAQVSAAWHESLWIPGSILAMMAALVGALLAQSASPVTPGSRPKEGVVIPLIHGGAVGLWAALGHAAGMTPAMVRGARESTWGVLQWQDVVVGGVGVIVLAVVGYCAGLVLRRWVFTPLVGLFVFVILFLPEPPLLRPLGLFVPVRQFQTTPRFELTAATTVFSVVAMATLALAAGHVATWLRRRSAAYQGVGEAVTWMGAVLILGVVAFGWRPEFYTVDRPVPRRCEQSFSVQVCLHAANEAARADITDAMTALQRAGLRPILTRVTDDAVAESDRPGPGEALLDLDPGPFSKRMHLQSVRSLAADRISAWLVSERCRRRPDVSSVDASQALQVRMLTLAGFDDIVEGYGGGVVGPAAEFFAGMDAAGLTDWVEQHAQQIKTCAITVPGG